MNLYEVLGVAPGADPVEIRRAYLALARSHHPDRHPEADEDARRSAAREMQRINQAWEVLGNAGRRAAYDRFLAAQALGPETPTGTAADDDLAEVFEDGRPGAAVPRWAALAPAVAFVAGLGCVAASAILTWLPMFVFGALLIVVALFLFMTVPFLAMARAARRHGPGA